MNVAAGKKITCDVLVVGGGVAGVAAALAAARSGARVILIEKNNYLGGAIVTGMHQALCGFYAATQPAALDKTLNAGLGDEFCGRLKRRNKHIAVRSMGKVFVLTAGYADVAHVLTDMIASTKQVRVMCSIASGAAYCDDGTIAVRAHAGRRQRDIFSRTVIDASGNAVILRALNLKRLRESSSGRQLAGFTIAVRGVNDAQGLLPIKIPYELMRAQNNKIFPAHCRFTQFIPGQRSGDGFLKISVLDSVSVSDAGQLARSIHAYLKNALAEMRQSHIVQLGEGVCPRQRERMHGEYVLTSTDVTAGARFNDAIARGAWPIEFWHRQHGPRYQYVSNDFYEIPRRCITPVGVQNVFAAGCVLSADCFAHASTRVSGIALATGEAAGMCAARAACSGKGITL